MRAMNLNLFILCLSIGVVRSFILSPDSHKYYHDITSGKGLYSNFEKVVSLSDDNFKDMVLDNSTSWLIEFYNSWCGHCHRFAPRWKRLALDVYNWKTAIRIGAVDCSNSVNTHLCRLYEVMYYPTVKYFPKFSSESFLGDPVTERDVNELRHVIIQKLEERSDLQLARFSGSLVDLRKSTEDYIIAIVDNNSSFIGQEVALDLSETKNVRVVVIDSPSDVGLSSSQAVYSLEKNNPSEISVEKFTRDRILTALDKLLVPKGFNMPEPVNYSEIDDSIVDVSQAIALMQIEEQIKKKLDTKEISDTVFQVDIEGALIQSLFMEIPTKKIIEGESLNALLDYLEILEYFPIGKNGMTFLTCLKEEMSNKKSVEGSEFLNMTKQCEDKNKPVFLESQERWLGCKGSRANLRGYPCSLWTMFHTLTVHADAKSAQDPTKVLKGMTGYIKHFFGCTECSLHFQSMATTISGNVSDTKDAILWLWKAHNNVNKRLAGDSTEDPTHPKVQFPPPSVCKNCSENNIWNETVVLDFMRRMYTKISFIIIEDITPPSSSPPPSNLLLRHDMVVDEVLYNKLDKNSSSLMWDFNIIDAALFFLLYLVSMAIILLVCFKFYRKTFRKKANYFDVFQKV